MVADFFFSQNVFIAFLFIGALGYIFLMIRKEFIRRSSCEKCEDGNCSKIDVDEIEKKIQNKK